MGNDGERLVRLRLQWSTGQKDGSPAAEYAAVWRTAEPGMVPVGLYWSDLRRGHVLAAEGGPGAREMLGADYRFVRREGYVLAAAAPGAVALHLYWGLERDEHVAAVEGGETEQALQAAGYFFLRTVGWVLAFAEPDSGTMKRVSCG